jgi:Leucine Rich Repeat.
VSVAVLDKKQPMDNVVITWDNLGLHKLHRHWLECYGAKIAKIDIHDNKLTSLPFDFFELLPNMEDLDMSCNMVEKLPEEGVQNSR